MVITSIDISNFINGKDYRDLVQEVKLKTDAIIDNSNPSVAIRDYCARDFNLANKINEITINLENIRLTIINDKHFLVKFFKSHNRLIKEPRHKDVDGEFPAGEEPSPKEKGVVVSIDHYPFSFMLGFLIKYYLVKNHPDKLNDYLKLSRIPNFRAYSATVRAAYLEAMQT